MRLEGIEDMEGGEGGSWIDGRVVWEVAVVVGDPDWRAALSSWPLGYTEYSGLEGLDGEARMRSAGAKNGPAIKTTSVGEEKAFIHNPSILIGLARLFPEHRATQTAE